jgi:hypothetical protein
MTLLGLSYLARFRSPLAAYNSLQTALMRRFLKQGGTPEIWLKRMAPAFRHRHGWICEGLVPATVRVRSDRRKQS